jgi:hypothetical protein
MKVIEAYQCDNCSKIYAYSKAIRKCKICGSEICLDCSSLDSWICWDCVPDEDDDLEELEKMNYGCK